MDPGSNTRTQRTTQIIEDATVIFSAKGFDNATTDDIAVVAGINKATIYLHFDREDTFIHSIAETLSTQELADLQAAYEAEGTSIEWLTADYSALIANEMEVLRRWMHVWQCTHWSHCRAAQFLTVSIGRRCRRR